MEIQIVNTGKRVVIARARFGHEPNQIVSVKIPPQKGAVQTLSFEAGDEQDVAKFKTLAKLLTDVKGPLGHALKGKKAVLEVTVAGGEAATTFAPVLAPKAKREVSEVKGAGKDKR